jgi:HEAT repeat protein
MALGAIGPKAKPATPVLLKLLKEGGVSVRVHSAEALGLIGREIGPEAIEQLTAALRDKSDNVQQSAVIALGRLGDAAKPSLPAIEKALADGIFNTPVDAVEAIYKITGDKQRVVPLLLVEAVGEDDPERAGELLAGLGESARPAVPKLIAHLASDNPQFRYYSAIALGHFGPHAKDAIPGLKKLADDPNPEIRDAAALAIEKIEGQAP